MDIAISDQLYAFDVVGRIWLRKTPMIYKRFGFSMEAVGTNLVACGGKDMPNVEIYDIADDQWTLVTDGVLEHYSFLATITLNDRVYAIGGRVRDADGTSDMDYVSIVDVDNVTVRRVSNFPLLVVGHKCALLTVPNTAPTADMLNVNNN